MPLGVIHCRDSGGRTPYIYGGADLAGCAGEKSNLHTNDLDPRRMRQGQVLLFSGLAAAGLRSKADDIGERIAVGILASPCAGPVERRDAMCEDCTGKSGVSH